MATTIQSTCFKSKSNIEALKSLKHITSTKPFKKILHGVLKLWEVFFPSIFIVSRIKVEIGFLFASSLRYSKLTYCFDQQIQNNEPIFEYLEEDKKSSLLAFSLACHVQWVNIYFSKGDHKSYMISVYYFYKKDIKKLTNDDKTLF